MSRNAAASHTRGNAARSLRAVRRFSASGWRRRLRGLPVEHVLDRAPCLACWRQWLRTCHGGRFGPRFLQRYIYCGYPAAWQRQGLLSAPGLVQSLIRLM